MKEVDFDKVVMITQVGEDGAYFFQTEDGDIFIDWWPDEE